MWHIYLLSGLGAIGNTLQVPAWMAAVSLLVPKKHLGRANGLVMTSEAVSIVVAPAAAGGLLATVGLGAVLLADVATFVVAVVTLARRPLPPPGAHRRRPRAPSIVAGDGRGAGATCGSAAACWACSSSTPGSTSCWPSTTS